MGHCFSHHGHHDGTFSTYLLNIFKTITGVTTCIMTHTMRSTTRVNFNNCPKNHIYILKFITDITGTTKKDTMEVIMEDITEKKEMI